MSIAAVIVAILSFLCFLASAVAGFFGIYLAAYGAPDNVTWFWLRLVLGGVAVGSLLGWAAAA